MALRVLLLILLLTFPVFAAPASNEETLDRAFHQGQEAFRSGDWNKAIADLETVRQGRPANQMALLYLGMAYKQVGKPQEAETALKKLVDVAPHFTKGYVELFDLYLTQARYPEAKQQADAILKYEPQNAQAFYLLGILAYEQGHLKDAVEAWEHTVKLYPDYPSAQYNLGWAKYEMHDYTAAEEHIQQAVLLAPHHPLYEFGLGYATWAKQETVKGAHSMEAARQDSKGSAFGTAADAFLSLQSKKWDDAIAKAKAAAGKEPRLAKAWVIQAQAYQQKNDLRSARLAAEKAVKADPNDFEAQALMASLPPVPPEASPAASPGTGWSPGVMPGSGWSPGVTHP